MTAPTDAVLPGEQIMPAGLREFLHNERLINDGSIDRSIRYCEKGGTGIEFGWFAFPVRIDGVIQYWKLRSVPGNPTPSKAAFAPVGANVSLFASGVLALEGLNRVVVCEGELDCLLLLQAGIHAVTGTGGAQTWKDEWCALFPPNCEVVLCFDHDVAGEKGRAKCKLAFSDARPDCALADIFFDQESKKGYDVTDFFCDGQRSGATEEESREAFLSRIVVTPTEAKKTRPVMKVPPPDEEMDCSAWLAVISKHFPGLELASEIVASVFCQLLIFDVHNPFALILTDRPSTGKTICINFFDNLICEELQGKDSDDGDGPPKGLTYTTDTFSQAAFVSNIAGRTPAQLEKIDLLPKIRHKALLIREMATMLSENDDKLRERMGQLTRVLDGEGFLTESGVYGQRGYRGEYNFMLVGASTAFPLRVWKVMCGLGHRLFFLGLHTPYKGVDDLLAQNRGMSFKKKETACKDATRNLLFGIWTTHKEGIEWDKEADDPNALRWIAKCAIFLSHLRGEIIVYKENMGGGNSEVQTTPPKIEDPSRIFTCLTNLARGHAVLCGRASVSTDDLRAVLPVVIDTAPEGRVEVLRLLLNNGGSTTIGHIRAKLGMAQSTAEKEAEKLIHLGVCDGHIAPSGGVQALPTFDAPLGSRDVSGPMTEKDGKLTVNQIRLKDEFSWLYDSDLIVGILEDTGVIVR